MSRGGNLIHLAIVSDYICPWCYIGLTRVEQLQREYHVEVEWFPFELRPNTPPQGTPFDRVRGSGRYTDEYLIEVKELAGEAGIEMQDRELIPNSRPSLEAAEWARERGGFDALHRAMFRAYFEEKADIGNVEVLRSLAVGCGLDGDDLVSALESRRYQEAMEEKLEWSRVAGEGGVPRFIFKATDPVAGQIVRRSGFVGAQDYEVFRRVVERLGARRRA